MLWQKGLSKFAPGIGTKVGYIVKNRQKLAKTRILKSYKHFYIWKENKLSHKFMKFVLRSVNIFHNYYYLGRIKTTWVTNDYFL